jgi:hypothetical protein
MAEKPKFVAQQSDAVFTAALWGTTRGTLLFAWTESGTRHAAIASTASRLIAQDILETFNSIKDKYEINMKSEAET